MVIDPLQRGVGIDQVSGLVVRLDGLLDKLESAGDGVLARLRQHLGRVIEADDLRLRPALCQRYGELSGAATEVDDGLERRAEARARGG